MENTDKSTKESKFYNDFIKPNLPKNKKEWVWFVLVILIVITLGLVAVNQYLAISYKATLILQPCNLCEDFQRNMQSNLPGGVPQINLSNIVISPTAT